MTNASNHSDSRDEQHDWEFDPDRQEALADWPVSKDEKTISITVHKKYLCQVLRDVGPLTGCLTSLRVGYQRSIHDLASVDFRYDSSVSDEFNVDVFVRTRKYLHNHVAWRKPIGHA